MSCTSPRTRRTKWSRKLSIWDVPIRCNHQINRTGHTGNEQQHTLATLSMIFFVNCNRFMSAWAFASLCLLSARRETSASTSFNKFATLVSGSETRDNFILIRGKITVPCSSFRSRGSSGQVSVQRRWRLPMYSPFSSKSTTFAVSCPTSCFWTLNLGL